MLSYSQLLRFRSPDERAAKRPRLETPPVKTLSPEPESDDERDELGNEHHYIQRDSQLTFAERVAIFAQDSAVEEFNEDGVKCSGCKGWLEFPVGALGNHGAVVAFWHDHRDKCMAIVEKERVLEQVVAVFPTPPSAQFTPVSNAGTTHSAPSSSARRKNEEQRIAILQADTLILTIEPHRVRCALCDKWIALRKDSSYCAYPWLQHRGKCVIRYQKKQGEDAGAAADGMEPEVVGNTRATPSAASTSQTRPTYNHTHPHPPRSLPVESEYPPTPFTTMAMVTAQPRVLLHNAAMPSEPRRPPAHPVSDLTIAPVHPFMTPISDMTRPAVSGPKRKAARAPPTLPRPNLNSNSGRASFIASSITHLFRTTHAPTDALSISALVAYVNAAVPPDRYEDFDTEEVARGAGAFCAAPETGFVMEGDVSSQNPHSSPILDKSPSSQPQALPHAIPSMAGAISPLPSTTYLPAVAGHSTLLNSPSSSAPPTDGTSRSASHLKPLSFGKAQLLQGTPLTTSSGPAWMKVTSPQSTRSHGLLGSRQSETLHAPSGTLATSPNQAEARTTPNRKQAASPRSLAPETAEQRTSSSRKALQSESSAETAVEAAEYSKQKDTAANEESRLFLLSLSPEPSHPPPESPTVSEIEAMALQQASSSPGKRRRTEDALAQAQPQILPPAKRRRRVFEGVFPPPLPPDWHYLRPPARSLQPHPDEGDDDDSPLPISPPKQRSRLARRIVQDDEEESDQDEEMPLSPRVGKGKSASASVGVRPRKITIRQSQSRSLSSDPIALTPTSSPRKASRAASTRAPSSSSRVPSPGAPPSRIDFVPLIKRRKSTSVPPVASALRVSTHVASPSPPPVEATSESVPLLQRRKSTSLAPVSPAPAPHVIAPAASPSPPPVASTSPIGVSINSPAPPQRRKSASLAPPVAESHSQPQRRQEAKQQQPQPAPVKRIRLRLVESGDDAMGLTAALNGAWEQNRREASLAESEEEAEYPRKPEPVALVRRKAAVGKQVAMESDGSDSVLRTNKRARVEESKTKEARAKKKARVASMVAELDKLKDAVPTQYDQEEDEQPWKKWHCLKPDQFTLFHCVDWDELAAAKSRRIDPRAMALLVQLATGDCDRPPTTTTSSAPLRVGRPLWALPPVDALEDHGGGPSAGRSIMGPEEEVVVVVAAGPSTAKGKKQRSPVVKKSAPRPRPRKQAPSADAVPQMSEKARGKQRAVEAPTPPPPPSPSPPPVRTPTPPPLPVADFPVVYGMSRRKPSALNFMDPELLMSDQEEEDNFNEPPFEAQPELYDEPMFLSHDQEKQWGNGTIDPAMLGGFEPYLEPDFDGGGGDDAFSFDGSGDSDSHAQGGVSASGAQRRITIRLPSTSDEIGPSDPEPFYGGYDYSDTSYSGADTSDDDDAFGPSISAPVAHVGRTGSDTEFKEDTDNAAPVHRKITILGPRTPPGRKSQTQTGQPSKATTSTSGGIYNPDKFFRYTGPPWPAATRSLFCHSCRARNGNMGVVFETCDHFFCVRCVMRKFPENTVPIVPQLPTEECPKCRGVCTCDLCCAKRGEKYVPVGRGYAPGASSAGNRPKFSRSKLSKPKSISKPKPKPKREPPPPPKPLNEIFIKPVQKHAVMFNLRNEPIGYTYFGINQETNELDTSVVAFQPHQFKRIFCGMVQPSWGLGPNPVIRFDGPIEPMKPPHKRGRMFVGDERVLRMYSPPPSSREKQARTRKAKAKVVIDENGAGPSGLARETKAELDVDVGESSLAAARRAGALSTDSDARANGATPAVQGPVRPPQPGATYSMDVDESSLSEMSDSDVEKPSPESVTPSSENVDEPGPAAPSVVAPPPASTDASLNPVSGSENAT
ncbi:hypothetical protein MKEN_00544500 [Mycena kentingensis (nom. inval.)]|nr:hypothetical protein MKEN_00544500 [Mycena kentingensis (nom. inval.)]